MDMPELDDKRLDEYVRRGLRQPGTPAAKQHAHAWARLAAAVGAQPSARQSSLIRRLWGQVALSAAAFNAIAVDEDRYWRAAHQRGLCPIRAGIFCYNTQHRFAYSMFQY